MGLLCSANKSNSTVLDLTIPQVSPHEYRWFVNTSDDPWNSSQKVYAWSQYHLDICTQIEEAFSHKLSLYQLDDLNFIKFNYKTDQHLQSNKQVCLLQRQVIRQIPSKVQISPRIHRVEDMANSPYGKGNTYFESNQMFCYSKIFKSFKLDESDPFIRQFCYHATLLDKRIASFLTTNFIGYLRKVHNLQIFNFNKLKDILSYDLTTEKAEAKSYVNYYVKYLTQENFKEMIGKMYAEEGKLSKKLNQVVRSTAFKQQIEYTFFFLCLLYIHGTQKKRIDEDTIVYRGTAISKEDVDKYKTTYEVDQVIVNNDFMSTRLNKSDAKSFMEMNSHPNKILFIIQIAKECCDNCLFSFKPLDISSISQYPNEKELIIPPRGVFSVLRFTEGGKYTKIHMKYWSNLYIDFLPYIVKNAKLAKQYGLYLGQSSGISEADYKTIVSLQSSEGGDIDLGVICKMPNLQRLDLSWKEIGEQGMKIVAMQFEQVPHLQELNLCWNRIRVEGMKYLVDGLSHLPFLKQLNLNNNAFGAEGMQLLSEKLSLFPNLESLNLEYCKIGANGMKYLSVQMKHLKKLRQLNLLGNRVGDEGLKELAESVVYLGDLRQLNLSRNKIGIEGIKEFASNLLYLENLQYLDLSQNEMGNEGLIVLSAQLSQLSHLNALSLQGNAINSKGIQALAENLVQLTYLDLSKNEIGNEGLQELASQLSHSSTSNLHDLYLNENQIGDEGIEILLSQSNTLNNLHLLNLCTNQIGNDGIKALLSQLKHLANLEKLEISKNLIAQEQQEKMKQELASIDGTWTSDTDGLFYKQNLVLKTMTEQFTEQNTTTGE